MYLQDIVMWHKRKHVDHFLPAIIYDWICSALSLFD